MANSAEELLKRAADKPDVCKPRGILVEKQMPVRPVEGNFLGGHRPYGCDVVAFNAEGKEVWRVVYQGHDRRLKVYPDGRPERFDGKRNRPPKALYETLKYRPSILDERVKYVRLIYRWYTTESITAGQIASRLNDLGVSPVFGPLWHQGVVKYLLANPVYVGRPTYNKQSNSRFMEFTGGQVKTAERKPSRKRAEADHIRPEKQEFKPMIDPDVFDKAQAKLAATKTRAYSPEDRRLMAQGLRGVWAVRQAHVGAVGQRPQLAGSRLHLLAISALGQTRPSGCGHFFVEHDLLESLVLDYLTQAAPQVKQLLDAAMATNLDEARPLLDAIHDAKVGRNGVWLDMLGFVIRTSTATRPGARPACRSKSFTACSTKGPSPSLKRRWRTRKPRSKRSWTGSRA